MEISSGSAGRGLIYLVTGVDENRAGQGRLASGWWARGRGHQPARYELSRPVGAVNGTPSERSHCMHRATSARSARGHLQSQGDPQDPSQRQCHSVFPAGCIALAQGRLEETAIAVLQGRITVNHMQPQRADPGRRHSSGVQPCEGPWAPRPEGQRTVRAGGEASCGRLGGRRQFRPGTRRAQAAGQLVARSWCCRCWATLFGSQT